MSSDSSGIDQKILHSLLHDTLSGTVEVYLQILHMFLDDTPKTLARLREACEARDSAQTAALAHNLKSNGLSLGAMKFSDYCGKIETAGRQGSIEGVMPLLVALEQEFAVCRLVVEEEHKAVSRRSA